MKIRNQITLSFLVIIILITLSMFYLSINTLEKFSRLNIRSTQHTIKAVTEENCQVSEDILLSFLKRIIKLETRCIAKELSWTFSAMKDVTDSNYSDIYNNPKVKAIASRDISSAGSDHAYFIVTDRKGGAVINPPDSGQMQKFNSMNKANPMIWEFVQDSFSRKEIEAEFETQSKNNTNVKKYIFIKQIENTPFNLCMIVDTNKVFQKLYGRIGKAGDEALQSTEEIRKTVLGQMRGHYMKISAVYTFVILIAGAIYGFVLGNYLSRPIAKLQQALQDLREGRVPDKLQESGSSEAKEVVHSFNDMTTMLRKEDVEAAFRKAKEKDSQQTEISSKDGA